MGKINCSRKIMVSVGKGIYGICEVLILVIRLLFGNGLD